VLQAYIEPYSSSSLNLLEQLSLMVSSFVLFCGVIFKGDDTSTLSSGITSPLSEALIILIFLAFLGSVCVFGFVFYRKMDMLPLFDRCFRPSHSNVSTNADRSPINKLEMSERPIAGMSLELKLSPIATALPRNRFFHEDDSKEVPPCNENMASVDDHSDLMFDTNDAELSSVNSLSSSEADQSLYNIRFRTIKIIIAPTSLPHILPVPSSVPSESLMSSQLPNEFELQWLSSSVNADHPS